MPISFDGSLAHEQPVGFKHVLAALTLAVVLGVAVGVPLGMTLFGEGGTSTIGGVILMNEAAWYLLFRFFSPTR